MPSKKSKPSGTLNSRSNAARTYSESELATLGAEIAEEIRSARFPSGFPRVLLRGPLGTGKSTLARAVLEALGIRRPSEGSPTFAIAHEYVTRDGAAVTHADGYRLKNELELEATGLLESLWNPEVIVLFEWLELFPETEAALRSADLPALWIELGFPDPITSGTDRTIKILRTGN